MSSMVKVGLFALIILIIAGFLIIKIEEIPVGKGKMQRIVVEFPEVAGLDLKAAVRVFGVRVGKVEKIKLLPDGAEVTLLVDGSLKIGKGAKAYVRNMGLLGDKYVELYPGDISMGFLEKGEILKGSSPVSYDDILSKLSDIGTNIRDLTSSFKKSLTGEEMEEKIRRIVENIEDFTNSAKLILRENREQVLEITQNLKEATAKIKEEIPRISEDLKKLLENIDGLVAENRGNVKDSLATLKSSIENLKASLSSLSSIMDKIDRGEGTIGKLINSTESHDKLVKTMDSISGGADSITNTLGRTQKWGLSLGFRSEALAEHNKAQTFFSVKLITNPKRFYLFEGVSDPFGVRKEKTEEITTYYPDGTYTTTYSETVKYDKRFAITAMFGWNFHPFSLRAGLEQNYGGIGIDYYLLKDKLSFSFDAFDFSTEDRKTHLKFGARYYPYSFLYLTLGYDDPLNKDRRSFFFGGGIQWDDEDFKYILTGLPSF